MQKLRIRAAVMSCALAIAFATTAAEARQHPHGISCIGAKTAAMLERVGKRQHAAVTWPCRRVRTAAVPVPQPKPKEAVATNLGQEPRARAEHVGQAGAPSVSDEMSARRRGHRRHHARHHQAPSSLITISTAGGSITVAASHADKFRGFIDAVVARGYRGPIKCYARGGHMPDSKHYRGLACDFAQRARNRTVRLMYNVSDLAAKWGLRDGCSWGYRDCGHIESAERLARGPGRRLVAQVPRPVWPVVPH